AFVKLRPKAMIEIPYAVQGGGTLSAGTGVFVLGDMHSDNTLTFRGWCESNVSSSSSILWMTFSVPASMNENVPTVETPHPDVTVYGTYMLNGTQYKAYELGTSTLTAANVGWLNAELDADTDNPGRIVIPPKGDVEVDTGVDFYGTLIVDGNLHIKGNGANRFTAVAEYPAQICCKNIKLGNDNATLLVNGAVVCKTLDLDRTDDSLVSISGALVTTDNDGIVDETGSNTYVTLQWNSHYAQYHDFRFTAEPYTLLSWTDY
ncbi:MAG: hypothetical protein KDA33_01150, partial [Phycisphaerales bacterium]|nr:hypothetical protein [Phycisphaerales bacterium]